MRPFSPIRDDTTSTCLAGRPDAPAGGAPRFSSPGEPDKNVGCLRTLRSDTGRALLREMLPVRRWKAPTRASLTPGWRRLRQPFFSRSSSGAERSAAGGSCCQRRSSRGSSTGTIACTGQAMPPSEQSLSTRVVWQESRIAAAVALHHVWDNCARVHKTLRVTPATEAGIRPRVVAGGDRRAARCGGETSGLVDLPVCRRFLAGLVDLAFF